MKITSIEILKVPPSWVWVKVHTDEGIYGLGEPYLPGHVDAVIDEVKRLEEVLIGQDPRRIEYLWYRMYRSVYYFRTNSIKLCAMSGLDMALWDIAGKSYDRSVAELMGGPFEDRISIYCGLAEGSPVNHVPPGHSRSKGDVLAMPGPIQNVDPEDWARECSTLVNEYGFRTVKIHTHVKPTLEGMRQVEDVVAIVDACRQAVGNDVDLAVDLAHPQPNVALHLVKALTPYRLLFIEDPQELETFDSLRRITEVSPTAIAASTEYMGKWAFYEAVRAGAMVLQPDLCHAGGITEVRKVATLAECAHGSVALHVSNSIVQFIASLHVNAAIVNGLVQEHNPVIGSWDGSQYAFGAGYLKEPLVLGTDGKVEVPTGPGLGIELDDDGMAEIMALPWGLRRA